MSAIEALLNECHQEMEDGDVDVGFNLLSEGLTELRMSCQGTAWSSQILPACKVHALAALLQEDPYTHRAVLKPRGYAGDAVMMDYLYFQTPPVGCSQKGKQIFHAVTTSPNGASVRWRRRHIAELIGRQAAHKKGKLSVLSVACGHCREGLLLSRETQERMGSFVALDHDQESLDVVRASLEHVIQPLHLSIKQLLTHEQSQTFDLVYSAGLYDYLSEQAAIDLTNLLFKRTAPGGTLMIANFTPDNWGRGYMEAFMDWQLVLRNKDDMRRLIPPAGVAGTQLYFDPYRNVIYLKMLKAV